MSPYLIYALFDPRTNEPRYVGRSIHGLRIPNRHARPGNLRRESNLHKKRWIESLIKEGLKPEVFVLESLESREATREAEQFWIEVLKSWGFQLTNKTRGGDGLWGFKHSLSSKTKMRKPKGPLSHDTRLAMSRSRGGRSIVDQNGTRYETAIEATQVLGLDRAHIYKVLKGTRKSVKGYSFTYAEETHGG